MKQPTRNQITRFEIKHQDCAGPYEDSSYVSLVTGKKYTAAYIARTYSDAALFKAVGLTEQEIGYLNMWNEVTA